MLYRLCTAPNQPGICHHVISLRGLDAYGARLIAAGIGVTALNMPKGQFRFSSYQRLLRTLSRFRPDVVQTWMYHADLVGGMAARTLRLPLVWGIRNSDLSQSQTTWSTRMVVKILASISRYVPNGIVSCSQNAALVHQELGYPSKLFTIIPNGYDFSKFNRDINARTQMRSALNISADVPLIGMVARWDPQKDHSSLCLALARLISFGRDFRCLLIGQDMTSDNRALRDLILHYGLEKHVISLGHCDDIPRIMNALDLHVLSSKFGEAFPNVLAEAMACGTPCVTTQVGDAGLIVGDTGWVVPPGDPVALAQAIQQALFARQNMETWASRQDMCRQRIQDRFSLDLMVGRYHAVWRQVAWKNR